MDGTGPHLLWGTPHSLYTGKVRSYLIKKGLPFEERRPFDRRYHEVAMPKVRLRVIPIVETPDGEMLQDSTAILDRLEADHPSPSLTPGGATLRFVAEVFDAYGTEFLLPVAMHYRWSYRAQQETFLQAEFGRGVYAGPDRDAHRAAGRRIMDFFAGFLGWLGVSAQTAPALEASCLGFLDLLDAHLQGWPYVLGGRPSAADFGLMAPLYAHLGRDPVPAGLMKTRAPNVARWLERMNTPGLADPEFEGPAEWFAPEDLPPTLEALLAYVFADIGPELAAQRAAFDAWAVAGDRVSGETAGKAGRRDVHPQLSPIRFEWRGVTVEKVAAAQTVWHFARAARIAGEARGDERATLEALVGRTGGEAVRDFHPVRGLTRSDYILVLE